MNEIEELRYLMDLMLSATRWVRETEDSPTGLELEIQDRIQKLTSVPTDRLVGPDDPAGTRPKKKSGRHSEDKVKVKVAGKYRRVPRSLCQKVPYAHSRTGYRWQIIPPVSVKAAQEEAMWNEHESKGVDDDIGKI